MQTEHGVDLSRWTKGRNTFAHLFVSHVDKLTS